MPFLRPRRRNAGLPFPAVLTAMLMTTSPSFAEDGSTSAAGGLSADERMRLEAVIHDYLMENPEVILDAVQKLERRRQAEAEERKRRAITERADELYDDPRAPVHGPDDASVTMVEFFDYQCGYCKKILPSVLKIIEDDMDLKIVFKELPILGPMSKVASKAALAAKRQDEYLEFHGTVMAMRGQLTEDRLFDAAASVGLDVEQLKEDMQDPEIDAYLQSNQELAKAIGITGTPALIIGGQLIPGAISYDQMVDLIEMARQDETARQDG